VQQHSVHFWWTGAGESMSVGDNILGYNAA
jgi:hypothetical protein